MRLRGSARVEVTGYPAADRGTIGGPGRPSRMLIVGVSVVARGVLLTELM